jgi:hypothetical protein
MVSCKLVNRLYGAIPLRTVRALLLRSHIEKCERCQAALLSREEAKALFVQPEGVGITEETWRKVSEASSGAAGLPGAQVDHRRRRLMWWQWAAGAATLIAVAAVGFWLLDFVRGPGPGPTPATVAAASGFEIKYVNIGGEPAQTFIYQPQGSEMIFIWASKTP